MITYLSICSPVHFRQTNFSLLSPRLLTDQLRQNLRISHWLLALGALLTIALGVRGESWVLRSDHEAAVYIPAAKNSAKGCGWGQARECSRCVYYGWDVATLA